MAGCSSFYSLLRRFYSSCTTCSYTSDVVVGSVKAVVWGLCWALFVWWVVLFVWLDLPASATSSSVDQQNSFQLKVAHSSFFGDENGTILKMMSFNV